jgi:hypothetical protein
MSNRACVSVTDSVQASRLARGTWLGRRFVFIDRRGLDPRDCAALAGFSWGAAEGTNGRRVLPLPRTGDLELPGVRVASATWPRLRLASLTSDKTLYREGCDTVHVLALDLTSPAAERGVVLHLNGREFLPQRLLLDEQGLAEVEWRDLPAGQYEAHWSDAPQEEPGCEFQVATYELAPLTASLVRSVLHDGRLSVLLQAESFGVPVEGSARIDLTDHGRRVDAKWVQARGGRLYATVELEGTGPHALQLQMVDAPSQTATVPLVGSRQQERAPTLFSKLGPVVTGSLLPAAGSHAVRGLYLNRQGLVTSPVCLQRVDGHAARIEFSTDVQELCVVVSDLRTTDAAGADVVLHRPNMAAGDALVVAVPRPAGLLSIGAFVDGSPWEGAAALLTPAPPAPQIRVPDRVTAGTRLTLDVASPNVLNGSVYVVVKDARLLSADRPASRLAAQIKRTVDGAAVDVAAPLNLQLADGYRGPSDRPPRMRASAWRPPRLTPEETSRGTEILVRRGVLSREQAEDVQRIARETSRDLFDIPPQLGYAEEAEMAQALAQELGLQYLDVATSEIPVSVVELIPEAVARENLVLPVDELGATVRVALSNPFDIETLEKLRFILNRPVEPVLAARTSLLDALNRAYGEVWGESADSMLYEFTDTAIDFTETELDYAGQTVPDEAPRAFAADARRMPPAQAEVLFAGLLPVRDGRATVSVELPETFTDYVAEATLVVDRDCVETEARFSAARDPFVHWHLPAHVQPGDTAIGRLHVGAASSRMRVQLTCNGRPVPLWCDGTSLPEHGELERARAELTFAAVPGEYAVEVHDVVTGACDRRIGRIAPPGKLRQTARAARVLAVGEIVSRSDAPDILSLQILPSPRPVAQRLVDATANYGYLCCEQTAAKLFASAVAYFSANGDPRRRARAEAAIRAGVRRQVSMWLRGRGFKAYPEYADVPSRYGHPATQHLLQMQLLPREHPPHLPPGLREDWILACTMAADAAEAYRLHWPELRPQSCAAAYGTARMSDNPEARQRALICARQTMVRLAGKGAVERRTEAAYAAATLLHAGCDEDLRPALGFANSVLQDLQPEGRLYSTLDSVAAIALLNELQRHGWAGGHTRVEWNGEAMALDEALRRSESVQSLRVLEGGVLVDVVRLVEEDWANLPNAVPIAVTLSQYGVQRTQFRTGESLELSVELLSGYHDGDIVCVCLPDALSRLTGGGQIKCFSEDFRGEPKLRIPLAATAATYAPDQSPRPQHFAVCVRNMFEEERAGNPGLLVVTVTPRDLSPRD